VGYRPMRRLLDSAGVAGISEGDPNPEGLTGDRRNSFLPANEWIGFKS
jgi:hypothetical protein